VAGGLAVGVEPSGPVDGFIFFGEGLLPAVEVKLDGGLVFLVSDGEQRLVGGVGFGAGEVVEMGLFLEFGRGGVALDVEKGLAVLGFGSDQLGVEVVVPEVALGVEPVVDVAGVLAL